MPTSSRAAARWRVSGGRWDEGSYMSYMLSSLLSATLFVWAMTAFMVACWFLTWFQDIYNGRKEPGLDLGWYLGRLSAAWHTSLSPSESDCRVHFSSALMGSYGSTFHFLLCWKRQSEQRGRCLQPINTSPHGTVSGTSSHVVAALL